MLCARAGKTHAQPKRLNELNPQQMGIPATLLGKPHHRTTKHLDAKTSAKCHVRKQDPTSTHCAGRVQDQLPACMKCKILLSEFYTSPPSSTVLVKNQTPLQKKKCVKQPKSTPITLNAPRCKSCYGPSVHTSVHRASDPCYIDRVATSSLPAGCP